MKYRLEDPGIYKKGRVKAMRNMKKAVSLLLAVSLVLTTLVGGDGAQAAKKLAAKVSSVKITNAEKKLRMQKGKTFKLKTSVKVKPNKSKYKKLKFSSSNKKVVRVSSKGVLKGLKAGTAKITVASKISPKKKASLSVTVTENKSQGDDDSEQTAKPPVQEVPGEITPSAGVPTQKPGQGEVSPSPEEPEGTDSPAPEGMTAEPTPKQMEEPGEVTVEPTEAPDEKPTPEQSDEPEPEGTVKPGKTPEPTVKPETDAPGEVTEKPGGFYGLSSPEIDDNGIVTWDCVYFGNYWQDDTNGDGIADKNDRKQLIKWRVLSVDGDDAFLLADENLDCEPYNAKSNDVTWETCTLRSWLNGYGTEANKEGINYRKNNFIDNAFSSTEQSAIRMTNVGDGNNGECLDRVYLLSVDEALNSSYGFSAVNETEKTRRVKNTKYAEEQRVYTEDAGWWLRSPGSFRSSAAGVTDDGRVHTGGFEIRYSGLAVRPALHLNLSSVSGWSYAGTVVSEIAPTPTPDNPRINVNGMITWDCVYFGNYWQNDTNGDGIVNRDDEKQPIKWWVLSVDGDDAFLLADQNLDCEPYNIKNKDVTWETCTLRSWLNGYGAAANKAGIDYSDNNFFDYAFSPAEQSAIYEKNAENADNAGSVAEGGSGVPDRVYLLSVDEALNPDYGFSADDSANERRRAESTKYADTQGAYRGAWWLRTPGDASEAACFVESNGSVDRAGSSDTRGGLAVRPVLHLNLSSVSNWSYAGTVAFKGLWVPPDPNKKVENVTITYDYEFPGPRVVRFDGTVENHEDEENAHVTGYPADGIDVRYYDRVIVKYEGGKLVDDESDDWYGKATLSSTDDGLGQNEYSDGLFLKYFYDVDKFEGKYQDGVYTVEYDIDEKHLGSAFYYADVGLIDCISVQLGNQDDYAGFKLKSIEFISSKNEPAVSEPPIPASGTPTQMPTPFVPEVGTSKPTGTPTQTVPPSKSPSQYGLENPIISDDGIRTWDCVFFGNYWQNDTNGDGKTDQKDEKQPIKWRVLSVDGDDAFLLADENLDCQPYNDERTGVTWETSTLRSWLNDDFLSQAFTEREQSAIRTTEVVNGDNPHRGIEGGDDTFDQVYLLSVDEVEDPVYGMSYYYRGRYAKNTEYAKGQGAYTATLKKYPGNSFWWLRSPGGSSDSASCVSCDGGVSGWYGGRGIDVADNSVAVRPVLHLNLESSSDAISTSSWSYAGKVTAGGQSTSTYIPWTPDPDKKVENVTLTYDYEFPGNRMVRFDGTVVDHKDENTNVEGYPADGIDIRYYDKVIVKYEGGKLTGDGFWYGRAALSSTDKGLGFNEYSDGFFFKYINDIYDAGKYQNGVYTVEYDIKEDNLGEGNDFEDIGLMDCISVQMANQDDFAGFKLKSIEFIAKKLLPATPTPTPTSTPTVPPSKSILENPSINDDGITTWDCVYFGNYWQNDTSGDGKANQKDKKQPIKWRVLSVDGDDVFLLADENLDCQPYNDERTDVTWEACTLRSWLNNDFLTQAFTAEEQSAIRTTKVVNDDNPYYGTVGGEDTSDQVYLLSIDEVLNSAYGFSAKYNKVAKNRRSKNTEYAKGQGAYTNQDTECAGNGFWWLRSPGNGSDNASYVNNYGYVYQDGDFVSRNSVAVRPALHLNLSSISSWSYAGIVTSEKG